jgi:hypothetical protein
VVTLGGSGGHLLAGYGGAATGSSVGQLKPRDISFVNAPSEALKLTFDFFPSTTKRYRWVALQGGVASTSVSRRKIGDIEVLRPGGRPELDPVRDGGVEWLWHVVPIDIAHIESLRIDTRTAISLGWWIAGEAQVAPPEPSGPATDWPAMHELRADGIMKIAASDWEQLLADLKFDPVLAAVDALVTRLVTDDHSWSDAENRLTQARSRLRRGETYAAMAACLSELERHASLPYKDGNWRSRFSGLPEQKSEGLAALMAGLGTYLNKIGYHRERQTGADTENALMPVDQWEAEIAVAASQLLLSMALRTSAAGEPAETDP